jgi:F0F1-type ATP synthase assembly protein I
MSSFPKAGATATSIKRSRASLVGGIATGIGVFILVVLLAGTTPASVVVALVIALAVGSWVRLADL